MGLVGPSVMGLGLNQYGVERVVLWRRVIFAEYGDDKWGGGRSKGLILVDLVFGGLLLLLGMRTMLGASFVQRVGLCGRKWQEY